ncbi:uncharacterized protein LY79DRAFT_555798 [Colletotrichum navitas]|uniref:Uncharacterized protein n=1 Tax=Colletotrichum navitas TaxID=681940 RepID=A0AAD8V464_9PEZI|nr:uncharacterized protein LY79DRAFT_555798 [Colletotrichum navitas]KAK1590072.1 hypothetical protein LY79DRAFT_555798 [Colletotrichum navitas]
MGRLCRREAWLYRYKYPSCTSYEGERPCSLPSRYSVWCFLSRRRAASSGESFTTCNEQWDIISQLSSSSPILQCLRNPMIYHSYVSRQAKVGYGNNCLRFCFSKSHWSRRSIQVAPHRTLPDASCFYFHGAFGIRRNSEQPTIKLLLDIPYLTLIYCQN